MWGSLTKACGSSLELAAVDDAFWAACRMAVRNIVCRCLLIGEEFVVVSDDNDDDTYTRGVVTKGFRGEFRLGSDRGDWSLGTE